MILYSTCSSFINLINLIKNIVFNVKNNIYGYSALYPSGPGLMKQYVDVSLLCLHFNHDENTATDYICKNNIKILVAYNGYRDEQKMSGLPPYYQLWRERKIYKE